MLSRRCVFPAMPGSAPSMLMLLMALFSILPSPSRAIDPDAGFFVFDDLTFGDRTIDFDTDAAGNPIDAPCLFSHTISLTEQYAPLGVHFAVGSGGDGGAILDGCSVYGVAPRSGKNFYAFNRNARTQDGRAAEPVTIVFDVPAPSVSIQAAGAFGPLVFRLDAFDRNGRLVASAESASQDFQPLSVASDLGIVRVVLSREAGARSARVSIPNVSGAPGSTVMVPIEIDGESRNVAAIAATLRFDDALIPNPGDPSAVLGPLLRGGTAVINAGTGSLRIAATGIGGRDGPGALLLIPATIPANAAPGAHSLSLADVTLADSRGDAIPVEVTAGTLTVTDDSVPSEPSFGTSVTATPASVTSGAAVTLDLTVANSGGPFTGAVIDLEVYNAAGTRVAQWFWEGQNLPTGTPRSYSKTWTTPATPGTYTVKAGVFGPDWAENPHWNDSAATVTVAPAGTVGFCGDLNDNGRVDVPDAILALRIAVGLSAPTGAQTAAACGNAINVALTIRILRTAVGLAEMPRRPA